MRCRDRAGGGSKDPGWAECTLRSGPRVGENRVAGVRVMPGVHVRIGAAWATLWLAGACFVLCACAGHPLHGAVKLAAPAPASAPVGTAHGAAGASPVGPLTLVAVALPDGRTIQVPVLPLAPTNGPEATAAAQGHHPHPAAGGSTGAPLGPQGPADPHRAADGQECGHSHAAEQRLPGMPLLSALALALLALPRPSAVGRWLRHLRARLTEGFKVVPEPVPRPS